MTNNRHNLAFLLALLAAAGCAARAPTSAPAPASTRWIATWSPSPSSAGNRPAAGMPDRVPTYVHATIREIVHTTIGGDHLRIRISNEFGDVPITIGSVHIALRVTGANTDPPSDRALTFAGKPSVTVRAGAMVVSDPIAYAVPQLGDLAISLYIPDSARTATRHALAVQTTYVSKAGDLTANSTFTADTTLLSWIFLSGVDVTNPRATGAIVTIGNSITDGYASTPNENHRWPDVLARRLLAAPSEPMKSVVNAGISGNRVLTFNAGPSAMARFDRDVLMIPGVTHVIMLEAINDISRGGAEAVTADEIIFGLRELAERAHEHGLVMYGATLTPFSAAPAANEAKRQAVNNWIRTSGSYDGVIDFDAITRDPSQPNRFLPTYDSGDHLHPSDAGYRAMGEAIDLALFRAGPRQK